MVIRDFSPEDYPAIFAVHSSQNIAWPEYPRTPEAWAEAERSRDPKCQHRRWVAVAGGGEDHRVVGFGAYSQFSGEYHPQRFHIELEVLPAYQRRGIGSALYDRVMETLQRFDPRVLRADAFSHLPQGFCFLQKRGFDEVFRETPVHLDASTFDLVPYTGLESNLASQGIVLKTARELEADPDRNRKIYTLYCQVNADVPHEDTEIVTPSFEEWMEWGLKEPYILPDAYLIAVHGEAYVGLRDVTQAGGALLGGLMGVRREYRKRGIALAMLVRNIRFAQAHGIGQVKDCTWVHNAAMQTLFNQLGFTRYPEWQQCQKNMRGEVQAHNQAFPDLEKPFNPGS